MKFPHQDPIEDKLKQLQDLDNSVFKDWHVTDQMKTALLERIHQQPTLAVVPFQKRMATRLAASTISACIAIGLFITLPWHSSNTDQMQYSSTSSSNTVKASSNHETALQDDQIVDPIVPIRRLASYTSSNEANMVAMQSATISSRHIGPEEVGSENGTITVFQQQTSSTKPITQSSNKQDSAHQPLDAKHSNTPNEGGSNPNSASEGVYGLLPQSDSSKNDSTAVGPMVASNQVNSNADTTAKLQAINKLANGNTIILSALHDGVYDVYVLPQGRYAYGWLTTSQIGIYVLPEWKLQIQLTQNEVNQVRKSTTLQEFSQYIAIEVAILPEHAPYMNQDDPIRDRLFQLSHQHQLYAIQVPDGSVAFFTTNQARTLPTSNTINLLPSSDYTFVARISDPTLYFYPVTLKESWVNLQSAIQWLVPTPQAVNTINTYLFGCPLYP